MNTMITRRSFVRLAALLSAAGFLPSTAEGKGPVFRTLGRTGLKVSEVGMGVMLTSDPDIVRAALDAGINYFDTARAYMGGRNEEILGRGLKGRRHEAIVATKCHLYGSKHRVISTVERSLQALGIDVIDILQLHNLSRRDDVLDEENLDALAELRQAGKIRFAGVTTHSNMVEVLEAALESGFYDTVLTSFNFQSTPDLVQAVEKAAAANLGVIAMKNMTGGYKGETLPGLNPFQAALRWVLEHRAVATTIPSMTTLEQLQEDVAVMGTTTSWRDSLSLSLYASVAGSRYCRACGGCLSQCTLGADIPAAMRAVMYDEGYGEKMLAQQTAAALHLPCGDCDGCTVSCSFSLDVPGRMSAALDLSRSADV